MGLDTVRQHLARVDRYGRYVLQRRGVSQSAKCKPRAGIEARFKTRPGPWLVPKIQIPNFFSGTYMET